VSDTAAASDRLSDRLFDDDDVANRQTVTGDNNE
jgi:hypothetical protein